MRFQIGQLVKCKGDDENDCPLVVQGYLGNQVIINGELFEEKELKPVYSESEELMYEQVFRM